MQHVVFSVLKLLQLLLCYYFLIPNGVGKFQPSPKIYAGICFLFKSSNPFDIGHCYDSTHLEIY